MKYYLAIDIGASSGRHILGWLSGDKLMTEEIYRFQNSPKRTDEGLIWDAEYLYREILNGLKKAREINKIPVSVGIDTWGVDYALLNEDKQRIGEVFCYRDSRNERSAPSVHKIIPFSELYEKTGIQYSSFNTVYQLFSDKESGKLKDAKYFLMLPDYFNFRLTGVISQEYTNATTTGIESAPKSDSSYPSRFIMSVSQVCVFAFTMPVVVAFVYSWLITPVRRKLK